MSRFRMTPALVVGMTVAGCFFLLQGPLNEFLGQATQQIVVLMLSLAGIQASVSPDGISWDQMFIAWSRDCSGFNLLFVLLAMALWSHGLKRLNGKLALNITLALLFAGLANVLRVLSIIGYRLVFYPHVESTEFHFFLGFLWVLPFALFFLRQKRGLFRETAVEAIYYSVCFGILAPFFQSSEQAPVIIAAVACLVFGQRSVQARPGILGAMAVWVLCGLGLVWLGMDSFWLPWMILFPLKCRWSFISASPGIALLIAACPAWGMLPSGFLIQCGLILGGILFHWLSETTAEKLQVPVDSHHLTRVVSITTILSVLLPMIYPILPSSGQASVNFSPPEEVASRLLPDKGYEIRLAHQPSGMGAFWYVPQNSSRHHSILSCLSYTGNQPQRETERGVISCGDYIYREYFVVEGKIIDQYSRYVLSTTGFGKTPGVHLIFVMPRKDSDLTEFSEKTTQMVTQLEEALSGVEASMEMLAEST